ncbi:hypothetical protein [Jannaschia sp. LMIT008]|uniref:hypothetical protein n=1 Tax=Jannaschia maritima TaxID=3032585 RepID=UPI00281104ED|nr:hypothetical protein [Jannaschia sp. LMIT008]
MILRAGLIALATAAPVAALELADCHRVTNPSHGGEAAHRDLSGGWVSWIEWWSQEGVFTDLHVADCDGHDQLTARLREENIGDRAFDRRRAASRVFEGYVGRAPAFYDMDDLADALARSARDVRVASMTAEVCACAAAYPNARGGLDPFALG